MTIHLAPASACLGALALLAPGPSALAQDVGITITAGEVTFFDTQQLEVIATVLPPPLAIAWPLGDCAVTADGALGYVSRNNGTLLVYDLTLDPPALAAGTNVVPVPTNAHDIALGPDDRFLAVTGWDSALGNLYPISVVDLGTRTVADTFWAPVQLHWAAAFGSDGSLLYASNSFVARLSVDDRGKISDTGERFDTPIPPWPGWISPATNLEIAPNGKFAVATYTGNTATRGVIVSLTIPGLQEVSRTRVRGLSCGWAGFSPDGRRLFAVGSAWATPPGDVEAFRFDPATGKIGPRLWTSSGAPSEAGYGSDAVAVDSAGHQLFAATGDTLLVRDARHGAVTGTLALPPSSSGHRSTAVAR